MRIQTCIVLSITWYNDAGSFSPPELALPPLLSPPEPQTHETLVPSLPPSVSEVLPPSSNTAPPPIADHVPAIPPADPRGKEPVVKAPISLPVAPGRWPAWISSIISLCFPHQMLSVL